MLNLGTGGQRLTPSLTALLKKTDDSLIRFSGMAGFVYLRAINSSSRE